MNEDIKKYIDEQITKIFKELKNYIWEQNSHLMGNLQIEFTNIDIQVKEHFKKTQYENYLKLLKLCDRKIYAKEIQKIKENSKFINRFSNELKNICADLNKRFTEN